MLVWCGRWAGLQLAYNAVYCIAWTILSWLHVCFNRCQETYLSVLYKNQVSRALPTTGVSSEELKQSDISQGGETWASSPTNQFLPLCYQTLLSTTWMET